MRNKTIIFIEGQSIRFTWLLIGLFLLSCSKKIDRQPSSLAHQTLSFNPIPKELPPPFKGKLLENLQPPMVIPLTKSPKKVPAHPNVHPAGKPTVVEIPKGVRVTTFGEKGVPFPTTVPVKKTLLTLPLPKPVPALPPVFRDGAMYNINYLSDVQGMKFGGGDILEDRRGHFWFSGIAGVVRYDGKNFW